MEAETNVVSSEDQTEDLVILPFQQMSALIPLPPPACGASCSSAGASPFSGGARRSTGASPFSGGASCSSGGASPFSSGASHSTGGASSFSGGASHSSGGASCSSGGASHSSGGAIPVGGSSEDGGIATDMGIKKIPGKSLSIAKKIKLPTQVALDSEGIVRNDFPFDQISSRHKLRTLTHHTLFPVHPKKKNMEDWIAEQGSPESLTTTTTTTSGDLTNVSFVFGQTQYGSYSCVDGPDTEDMTNEFENSSMIMNVSSRNTTDVDVDGDETKMDGGSDVTNDAGGVDVTNNNNMSSESTLGLAELFSSTPNATAPESSLDDSQVDAHHSSDSTTIGTVPESSLNELQGDADGSSNITVTEKLTGINDTAQVDQSALLVRGDGEKHVTITVHSDVTGLVANISKQWKEYSKCMKNLSLTTCPVVSLPHLHSTAPPNKPASGANVYNMTTSVPSKETSGKKIKIYIDEDLDIEHKMIQSWMRERKEDPTKGPEISKYFLFAVISLLGFWEIV